MIYTDTHIAQRVHSGSHPPIMHTTASSRLLDCSLHKFAGLKKHIFAILSIQSHYILFYYIIINKTLITFIYIKNTFFVLSKTCLFYKIQICSMNQFRSKLFCRRGFRCEPICLYIYNKIYSMHNAQTRLYTKQTLELSSN